MPDDRPWPRDEKVLWDGTRVDVLGEEYAVEIDPPEKWAESIGQALYYAIVSGRRPGIVLQTDDAARDARFIYRCQTVAAKYGIRLWVEQGGGIRSETDQGVVDSALPAVG